MSYTKHNFVDGHIIYATPFNEMEDQIAANETAYESLDTRVSTIENGPGGLTQGERTALVSFINEIAQMIPNLTYTSEMYDGAAALGAAQAAVSALGGSSQE